MEDADEEKVKLLESLRLQDAALSVVVGNSFVTLDSDSDVEAESGEDVALSTVIDGKIPGFNELDSCPAVDEESRTSNDSNNCKNPSWADALEANQEYDSVLAQLESEIKQSIAKVVRQLNEVQNSIQQIHNSNSLLNMKSQFLYVFGMPYFKTENYYPCPFNEDYHNKKKNREICYSELGTFHQWVPRHKKLLNEAVAKFAFQKCLKEAKLKLAVLRKELDIFKTSGNVERTTELEQELRDFDVRSVAESMLDDEIANGDHDWMKISASVLDGKQSPESCKSFWNLYLHPKINKKAFTEDEECELLKLAEKHKHQDWDKIAEELGTNRSGYQCFIVFQNKLNAALKRNTWEPWEDKKLLQAVERHRIGNFIPWGKVAYDMENRTKAQVFNRWSYSLNPAIKKGRFTEDEDIMILVGVQMWGEDFQRISHFLKDRTTSQVRDRFRHYLNRAGMGIPWTSDEDQRLLELAEKHGRKWAIICKWFPNKDRTQVRHRYNTLARWRAKNPDAPLTDAPARPYVPNQSKHFQEQWNRAKDILSCDTIEDMMKAKNDLVTSLTKKKRRSILEVKKKKKPSPIETDLVNYFRCSYELPGGPRKVSVRKEEAKQYAKELSVLFQMFKLKLNLPCVQNIEFDKSLTSADKDILTNLVLDTIDLEDPLSESNTVNQSNHDLRALENTTTQLFGDDTELSEEDPPSQEYSKNIDYVQSHDISSLYIDLPLMNFTQDEVVADRNKDPSFFEPPSRRPGICDTAMKRSPVKGKEMYICPPNLTTLVGLRTFLLNRRNLVARCNKDLDKEDLNGVSFEKLEEAKKKFDERMFCLFLWPALMSRYGPSDSSSIFDDEKKKPATVPNPVPIRQKRRKKSEKKKESAFDQDLSTHPISESQMNLPSTSKDSSNQTIKRPADTSIPSTSGLPTKRRKIVDMESDDPDDPDIV
ncbi:snRNA-activating protein complex subunit 4 [Frankliniella fusca]|uniref:snRNA-activating protein complex subunit 4 n=1 Tax=Frankliniella fusca TaxID=407009 RepID=A0AAE1HKV0_9NEOP|nr:snRNA-activating protein complex subunit 4 [Frankliniella fusca]